MKKFHAYCGSQSFITAFTNPVNCPYRQPDLTSPCTPSHLRISILILSYHLSLDFLSSVFPSAFHHQIPVYTNSIRATCPAHFILLLNHSNNLYSHTYKHMYIHTYVHTHIIPYVHICMYIGRYNFPSEKFFVDFVINICLGDSCRYFS